ncbi:MAG TPA: hypothetical protein VG347_14670 [Verrucomicrobiae bacterium]|nr:hypothetical protein [Verrucomicrobiae bacterium]
MSDEITITKKSNPEPSTPAAAPGNKAVSVGRTELVNLCALGLGVSFFLPWAQFFGANLSGFDLQKMGDQHRLLWAIPVFCVVTIIAGFAKQSQKHVAQITGVLPYVVGVYWYLKLKDDLFHILTYGAFLSLAFGVALLILPRNQK